jgi:hypothetical protein
MNGINTNAIIFVTVYKISPNPSLSKRGINSPFEKGG